MTFFAPLARSAAFVALMTVAACGAKKDISPEAVPLGDFALGHNIVVADKMQQVGPSREATPEEWKAAVGAEIDKIFSPYQGEKLYHVAVSVDAYALALPGIPVVLNPKSVLVISANVWDDAAGAKLNAEPKQITVFESASGKGVIGSGLTQTKEEQMANLSRNAVIKVQEWLAENPQWFGADVAVPTGAASAEEIQTLPEVALPPADGIVSQPLPENGLPAE